MPLPVYLPTKGKGYVNFVERKEMVDAIRSYTKERMDELESILNDEIDSMKIKAEETIKCIYSENQVPNESGGTDKWNRFMNSQKELNKIFEEGPSSKLKVLEELDTILDDCLKLFDFNESRFSKLAELPTTLQEHPKSEILKKVIYSSLLMMALSTCGVV